MSLNIPSVIDESERMELPPSDNYPCAFLHVIDSKIIHQGERVDVYRATLKEAPPDGKADIVYKVAYGRAVTRLRNEANTYRKLSEIQGECVPRCHGYFTLGVMSCLVLDYCGEPITESFIELEWAIRVEVAQVFWGIHGVGVQHKDLAERNVLRDGDNIYVIDFEHALLDHECKADAPRTGSIAPEAPNYACMELWNIFTKLGIWVPSHFTYADEVVPLELVWDPNELAKKYCPGYWTMDQAVDEAWAVAKEFARIYLPRYYADIRKVEDERYAASLEKQTASKSKAPAKTRRSTRSKQASGVGSSKAPDTRPKPVPRAYEF